MRKLSGFRFLDRTPGAGYSRQHVDAFGPGIFVTCLVPASLLFLPLALEGDPRPRLRRAGAIK